MTEPRPGPAVWVATCGGAGYFPIAPGTAGSLVGLALVVVAALLPFGRWEYSAVLGGATGAIFALGVWAAGQAEKFFGRVDPGQVVIDEVVGQMTTFLIRPDGGWRWLVAGFILFRIFDIIKPFPARQAERAPGGWGIMLDDVVAGLYSLLVLTAVRLALR